MCPAGLFGHTVHKFTEQDTKCSHPVYRGSSLYWTRFPWTFLLDVIMDLTLLFDLAVKNGRSHAVSKNQLFLENRSQRPFQNGSREAASENSPNTPPSLRCFMLLEKEISHLRKHFQPAQQVLQPLLNGCLFWYWQEIRLKPQKWQILK